LLTSWSWFAAAQPFKRAAACLAFERILGDITNIGRIPRIRIPSAADKIWNPGKRQWMMVRIAEALNVRKGTISKDLADSRFPGKQPDRPKGGRPKGSPRG
jgi:hypothetical protein